MLSRNSSENTAIVQALDKSQAIIHFTPDGTILWANKNFLHTMGYKLDDIAGKHHSLFVDATYAKSAEYKMFWDSLAAGTFQSAQYKRYGKEGQEIWIEASYNPVIDKKERF